jgi:hypothetical protein
MDTFIEELDLASVPGNHQETVFMIDAFCVKLSALVFDYCMNDPRVRVAFSGMGEYEGNGSPTAKRCEYLTWEHFIKWTNDVIEMAPAAAEKWFNTGRSSVNHPYAYPAKVGDVDYVDYVQVMNEYAIALLDEEENNQ